MAKVHQEETSYVLIDWMGGPDGKLCGSRLGQHQMCVLTEGQILSGPALPTIDGTQLGSHCCFEIVFWRTCPSSRATLGGKGRRGRAQHVNVIPSIDPTSNVTDCSSVNKHFIIWQLCFWIFFDGAKTHSWQHLPRFAPAFLRRAVQYVAQYPDGTSIRTLKTKTQFLRCSFQLSVNKVCRMKAEHFGYKMKFWRVESLRNSRRRRRSVQVNKHFMANIYAVYCAVKLVLIRKG